MNGALMPAKLDEETRGKIVQLRALDYDKTEIAERLDISRNTVSRHLEEVREQYEEADDGDEVVLDAVISGIVGAGLGLLAIRILKNTLEETKGSEEMPSPQDLENRF